MDEDINIILDNILEGAANKKIKTMVQVHGIKACQDTFGAKESKGNNLPARASRGQWQIVGL